MPVSLVKKKDARGQDLFFNSQRGGKGCADSWEEIVE